MKKILSLLFIFVMLFTITGISVTAQDAEIPKLIVTEADQFEPTGDTVVRVAPIPRRDTALTVCTIYVSKSGSTATFAIDTGASQTASQIGFKDCYIKQRVKGTSSWSSTYVGTYYTTNASYYSKAFNFQMSSGYEYMIDIVDGHYCIINGTTFKQPNTTGTFSM